MAKENILQMYQGFINSTENEVKELREKLDDCLDYLGQMNRKKYELENNIH